jgi:hypothetical protein
VEMKQAHEEAIARRGARMTEFEGKVHAEARGGESVTGVKTTRPTRFLSGTEITAKGEGVRKVTGLHIGGDEDG